MVRTYQICSPNLLNDVCFMGLGVYGTVIGNGVHFFPITANLRHGVLFGLLELINDAFHHIHKDHLDTNQRMLHDVFLVFVN